MILSDEKSNNGYSNTYPDIKFIGFRKKFLFLFWVNFNKMQSQGLFPLKDEMQTLPNLGLCFLCNHRSLVAVDVTWSCNTNVNEPL